MRWRITFSTPAHLVKRHVIEAGSPWVKSLVRAKAAHTLYVARITAIEVTSAITRRQRAGSLSAAQGGAILGHFRRHLTQRYVIVEVAAPLLAAGHASRAVARPALRCRPARARRSKSTVTTRTLASGRSRSCRPTKSSTPPALAEGLIVEDPNTHT